MSNKGLGLRLLASPLQTKSNYASTSDADEFDFNYEEEPMVEHIIIGGESAEPNEFPYQVALFEIKKFICGGAILTMRHIVTAGHCVSK